MKKTRNRLWIASFVLLFAWTAILFPQDADDRRVTFSPAEPAAGLTLVFTASHFRTPNLLQWDMGDGTRLTSGGTAAKGKDVTLAYSYAAPGRYLVKVFDDGGNTDLPPVTVLVAVSATPRMTPEDASPPPPATAVIAPTVAAPQPVAKAVRVEEKPAAVNQARLQPAPAVEARIPRRKKYSLVKIGPYVGYYRPRDMLLKQIYGEGDVIYGARLGIHLWKGFYLWLSGSRYQIISKTTFTEDKTNLTLLPVSGFLRYSLRLGFFNPYVGIGYTYLSFKEESALGNVSGSGNNMTYEGGFEIRVNRSFIMDFSVRFDQIKVNPTGFEIDLGGLHAGVALLVSF